MSDLKEVITTTQFRRDIKKYSKNDSRILAMQEIVLLLRNRQPIPAKFRPHKLKGNFNNKMECHIGNDLLLVWFDDQDSTIVLHRFGTHSQLFE